MKKAILFLIMFVFSVPVLASCSIDSNKPCTAENNVIKYEYDMQRSDPNPFDSNSKKYEVKDFEKSSKTGGAAPIKNEIQNYNSNCQFGMCLPSKHTNEIKK